MKILEADNISCDFIWLFKNKFVPLWRVFHGYIKLFSAVVVVKRWRFLLYTCACVCVKDEKLGIFPDVDAVKRQEMPNLPLFSVSDGFKLENGIVIWCCQNKCSDGLKNTFCIF